MSARVGNWQQGAAGGKVMPGGVSGPNPEVRTHAVLWAARVWALLRPVLLGLWARVEVRRTAHRGRSLRVLETIGMGEKRFVAIVQVQDAQFLIGGGSAGVSLLARLDREQNFAAVLNEQAAPPVSPPPATQIGDAW